MPSKYPQHHIVISKPYETTVMFLQGLEEDLKFDDQDYFLSPHDDDSSILITNHSRLAAVLLVDPEFGKEMSRQEALRWFDSKPRTYSKCKGDKSLLATLNLKQ